MGAKAVEEVRGSSEAGCEMGFAGKLGMSKKAAAFLLDPSRASKAAQLSCSIPPNSAYSIHPTRSSFFKFITAVRNMTTEIKKCQRLASSLS
jgi:hypothetical protein